MSDQLPNEEMDQQFDDLPLPDEEASWQRMKELLDKDDDDDHIIPPVFLRSCLGWGAFLLLGLTVAWFIIRPEKWWSNETEKTQQTSLPKETEEGQANESIREKKKPISEQIRDKKNEVDESAITVKTKNKVSEKDIVTVPNQNESTSKIKASVINKSKKKLSSNVIREKPQRDKTRMQNHISKNDEQEQKDTMQADNKDIVPKRENKNQKDTLTAVANQPIVTDTTKRDNSESIRDSIIQKETKQDQKKFFLAAGIGEQQQIPVAGQTAVPYSRYGRKGSLSDYVPSVYIQLHKEKKWFLQAEFRYGAAQSVKEFFYNRKTNFDSVTQNVSVTTLRLKKTYYHQLPLTFNYYLKQNLSLGIGGMYSRFYRAITEKEIQTLNVQTQATTSFKEIIPIRNFTDSFLYKTQVHVLVQADYQWRKFSFGLRYTKDIQPYIKYTKPDGTVDEEKNRSLQLIVRYRVWKSKKF